MDGWEAWEGQRDDGAVESEQRVVLRTPVVDFSVAGGEHLGRAYWREVERITGRLVQARERQGSIELRLLGRGPSLLRFGPPTIKATSDHRLLHISDRGRSARAARDGRDPLRAGR